MSKILSALKMIPLIHVEMGLLIGLIIGGFYFINIKYEKHHEKSDKLFQAILEITKPGKRK